MAVQPLTDQEIQTRLEQLPGWSFADDRLSRTYVFKGHPQAAGMVAEIATIQEELDHHSDLTLGYNKVGVSVNTHSAGGRVTALDVELAGRIEEIAPQHGARAD